MCFCVENIHRFLPITDWAVVLPANPIAPAAWSTARICAGDGPAVPVRQSFRRDEGDPECFLLQLCAPFPPGCAHSIALSPSHLLPYLQGSWSFFITQCRKVPHVWARICSMSPSSGSQSITRGGQGGFPKCDPSSQQCERNSERATGSPAAPGVAAMAPQSAVLPQKSNPKRRSPVVPLLPSDSGGSWLCNVYMSTELTMATQSSSRLRGEQPNSPGARGACAGLGKELSAAGGAGEVSHTLNLVFSISELQLPKGLFVQVEFLQWPRPCPRSLPLIPAVCWEDAGLCLCSELSASQQHQQ